MAKLPPRTPVVPVALRERKAKEINRKQNFDRRYVNVLVRSADGRSILNARDMEHIYAGTTLY